MRVKILKISSKSYNPFEYICKTYKLSSFITKNMNVRWNSSRIMINMYSKRKQPLRNFFNGNLHDLKIKNLEQQWQVHCITCIGVLRPFKQATVKVSCYNYDLASKVLLMIKRWQCFSGRFPKLVIWLSQSITTRNY